MVNPHEEKCTHEKPYGKNTDYAKQLKKIEEMGVICIINTVK